MKPARYVLGEHDGIICVVCEDTVWSEPKTIRLFWPTTTGSSDFKRDFPEIEMGKELSGRDGQYGFSTSPHYGCGFWKTLRLTNGGQTKPIHVEEYDLPCPKTRCRTRYLHGEWQKLLKSEGWVPA